MVAPNIKTIKKENMNRRYLKQKPKSPMPLQVWIRGLNLSRKAFEVKK